LEQHESEYMTDFSLGVHLMFFSLNMRQTGSLFEHDLKTPNIFLECYKKVPIYLTSPYFAGICLYNLI